MEKNVLKNPQVQAPKKGFRHHSSLSSSNLSTKESDKLNKNVSATMDDNGEEEDTVAERKTKEWMPMRQLFNAHKL